MIPIGTRPQGEHHVALNRICDWPGFAHGRVRGRGWWKRRSAMPPPRRLCEHCYPRLHPIWSAPGRGSKEATAPSAGFPSPRRPWATCAGVRRRLRPSWQGVRDATAFGNRCPQVDNNGQPLGNEDCLTLNVYAVNPPASSNQPVIVFIHGGRNDQGQCPESAVESSPRRLPATA